MVGPLAAPELASLELPQVHLLCFTEGHLIFFLVISVPDCAMQTSAKVVSPAVRADRAGAQAAPSPPGYSIEMPCT